MKKIPESVVDVDRSSPADEALHLAARGVRRRKLSGMDYPSTTSLRAKVLWLAVRRTSVDGRACREYEVTADGGEVLLVARAFLWGREMSVATPDGRGAFTVLRSRLFPLTGKAAVNELPSGLPIGTVTRSGTFRDSTGAVRGRFRDARSFGDRAKESLFQAAMEAILSTGGDSVPSGPDALVLHVDGAIAGTLTYGTLPFGSDADAQRAPADRATRVFPRLLREAWRSLSAARAWKFVRFEETAGDPRLELAAALFAAELARW